MEQPLLYLNASLTLLLAAVVWRAAPDRRENRALALLSATDALTGVVLAALLASGRRLLHGDVMTVVLVGRLLILLPALEFAHALPYGTPLPARWRRLAVTAIAVGLFLTLVPATRTAMRLWAAFTFFPPFLVAVLMILGRHRRLFAGRPLPRGLLIVWAVTLFRWAVEMGIFVGVRKFFPGSYESAVHVDVTWLGLVTFSVLAYATLEHQLFSVRGVLAEVAVLGTAAVTALFCVAGLVGLLLRQQLGQLQRPLLTAISLLPLLFVVIGWSLRRRLGTSLMMSVDRAAARRHAVLERALRATNDAVDRGELVALSCAALAEIAPGGRTSFVAAGGQTDTKPGLDPPVWITLDRYFAHAGVGYLLRDHPFGLPSELEAALKALPGELLLPIRYQGELRGLLCLQGGRTDRETALAAMALAENLAAKLERSDLFERALRLQRELDDSRRLAIVGTFAAGMAHDVRTPLTSIQMNLQMLRRTVPLPPEDMESLDIALEESRRLGGYVAGVLDFVKPTALTPTPADLASVAEEAARQVEALFAGLKVRLERQYSDMPLALIDGRRMVQVLVNLLQNAAQASAPGATVTLSTRAAEARRVAVEVTDRGRGIEPQNLSRLFEPFFTTRADGTGLGLAIVQKLVRAHGGEVEVSSSPEGGTTFRVALPMAC